MSTLGNHDPRAVANALLDRAARPMGHIALQKLLYFAHGFYLARFKTPLVKGYFEAWHYGPVHPAVYKSFKDAGNQPIRSRAASKDLRTGEFKSIPPITDETAIEVIDMTLRAYRGYTDKQLVDLSHADDGPWDVIKKRADRVSLIGLKIPNQLISERFFKHKLSTDRLSVSGDLSDDEDAPIAYHRLG
jgi:uncharacterized phage-associated protein